MGQGMGRPGLNRRQLLTGPGGLTVAGSPGFAAPGTGADALATGMNSHGIQWARPVAGGLLAGLPLIVVFVLFRRRIVAGVAHIGPAGQ
ncbi:hypothetical protein SAMN05216505_101550 [Streptomyces prasinopilosus]|uniref:Uncharacterized protein n=1 Tax=Streptomyces prasinopilosus TaxID=67344 RepID=A0A1G6J6N8_9ACTN|nr:hypothetical protein SAMN05216505_101550 [Streptomyces prasinopilosus]